MRIRVNSCRWPRLRREFLRRRFLKAMTLAPRPCSSTSAATLAPDNRRRAERGVVAAQHQHLAELDDLAGLALDLLDLEHLSSAHPVLLAAGFDDCEHRSSSSRSIPALGSFRTGFFQSICVVVTALTAVTNGADRRPAPRRMLMAARAGTVKNRAKSRLAADGPAAPYRPPSIRYAQPQPKAGDTRAFDPGRGHGRAAQSDGSGNSAVAVGLRGECGRAAQAAQGTGRRSLEPGFGLAGRRRRERPSDPGRFRSHVDADHPSGPAEVRVEQPDARQRR